MSEVEFMPYGEATIVQGKPAVVCPECSQQIIEEGDEHGETTTNRYAQHCREEHPQAIIRRKIGEN